jgi:hypothetical protein
MLRRAETIIGPPKITQLPWPIGEIKAWKLLPPEEMQKLLAACCKIPQEYLFGAPSKSMAFGSAKVHTLHFSTPKQREALETLDRDVWIPELNIVTRGRFVPDG